MSNILFGKERIQTKNLYIHTYTYMCIYIYLSKENHNCLSLSYAAYQITSRLMAYNSNDHSLPFTDFWFRIQV